MLSKSAPKDLAGLIKDRSVYEDQLLGIEHEENENVDIENKLCSEIPFDADKIRVEPKTLSLEYILKLIVSKKLNLSPEFQRNKVWDITRKSLLIESLMLRIPIPAFYFYEDEDANKYVIDGLQRLSTIHEYLNGDFKLKNLQYLGATCDNKTFMELDSKYVTRIYDTQFIINIIDARTPAQVKYDIFRRINTGGVPLNPQEIRNIMAQKRTRTLLNSLASSKEFIQATRGRIKDLRMDAQELVLRFLAFYNSFEPNLKLPKYYSSDLLRFLDIELERLNHCSENDLLVYKNAFKRAMIKAYALFGEKSFSKPDFDYIINKALFTSWSVILAYSQYEPEVLSQFKIKAINTIKNELKKDPAYNTSLTQGTNSKKNVERHFRKAYEMLEEIVND